jgi:hypothetical protein
MGERPLECAWHGCKRWGKWMGVVGTGQLADFPHLAGSDMTDVEDLSCRVCSSVCRLEVRRDAGI